MIPKLSAWSLIRNATGADSAPRRSFVLAVLEIYQRYGVYIGGQLAYADLVQQWPAAGFRRNDLETALDDAVAAGLLSFDDRDGEPALVLLSTQWPEDPQRPLIQRLRQGTGTAIIAEMKKASPSAGVLVADYRPAELAVVYRDAGAAALSVLTEPHHFLGRLRISPGNGLLEQLACLRAILLFVDLLRRRIGPGEQRFGLLLQADKPAGVFILGTKKSILRQVHDELDGDDCGGIVSRFEERLRFLNCTNPLAVRDIQPH